MAADDLNIKINSDKTCNYGGFCQYKTLGSTSYGCRYAQYCDFQAPRDSRPVIQIIGMDEICDVCKQPKSRCEGHLRP